MCVLWGRHFQRLKLVFTCFNSICVTGHRDDVGGMPTSKCIYSDYKFWDQGNNYWLTLLIHTLWSRPQPGLHLLSSLQILNIDTNLDRVLQSLKYLFISCFPMYSYLSKWSEMYLGKDYSCHYHIHIPECWIVSPAENLMSHAIDGVHVQKWLRHEHRVRDSDFFTATTAIDLLSIQPFFSFFLFWLFLSSMLVECWPNLPTCILCFINHFHKYPWVNSLWQPLQLFSYLFWEVLLWVYHPLQTVKLVL